MSKEQIVSSTNGQKSLPESKEKCGVVRPISGFLNYDKKHWDDVGDIINASIGKAGLEPQLVFQSDDNEVIHSRIVNNVFALPIIVCDVSGRNPNVMFELGMRIAFGKAVIVIQDNPEEFMFDTGPIEHLIYDKNLRHGEINTFIENLSCKIKQVKKEVDGGKHKAFIDTFGSFDRKELAQLDKDEFRLQTIMEELASIKKIMMSLSNRVIYSLSPLFRSGYLSPEVQKAGLSAIDEKAKEITESYSILDYLRAISSGDKFNKSIIEEYLACKKAKEK